jgi:hypothetical protein
LALLRQRFHRKGLKEAWELEALRVLKALRSFKIGVLELQSTGLGSWSCRGQELIDTGHLWMSNG